MFKARSIGRSFVRSLPTLQPNSVMWEMQWVGWVVTDVWIAIMLAYIVYLLLPDENSSQYAYAMQLPQDDSEVGRGGFPSPPGGGDDDYAGKAEMEEIEIELADFETDAVVERLEETINTMEEEKGTEKAETEEL